ncbi:hypothetical protein ACFYXD_35525 [Streptomyces platensis]|uniref:hypothetical protein n=1 Tax=Streptomyces platensis TaxID=58346 RepID=UPI003679C722
MAIAIPSPAPAVDDLVPLKDASAFLSQSGHSVSVSTLYRWIDRYEWLTVVRRGRKNLISMSAALRAQRDELDRLGS